MIKNLRNIDIAKHVIIAYYKSIIEEAKKEYPLDLKKIKKNKKRLYKKKLKEYIGE